MDLLIAATAAANGARLATRNARDLLGLEDLVDIVDLG
jgi:predicted nucleic acid-binding protein